MLARDERKNINCVLVPPETGASTICAPAAMTSAATSLATLTSRVVESMHSVCLAWSGGKRRSAARTPPSSVYTARTCGDDGSMVITVCDALTALEFRGIRFSQAPGSC